MSELQREVSLATRPRKLRITVFSASIPTSVLRKRNKMQMPMGGIPIPAPKPQGPYAKLKAALLSYGRVRIPLFILFLAPIPCWLRAACHFPRYAWSLERCLQRSSSLVKVVLLFYCLFYGFLVPKKQSLHGSRNKRMVILRVQRIIVHRPNQNHHIHHIHCLKSGHFEFPSLWHKNR